jgi:hypothetical protein
VNRLYLLNTELDLRNVTVTSLRLAPPGGVKFSNSRPPQHICNHAVIRH